MDPKQSFVVNLEEEHSVTTVQRGTVVTDTTGANAIGSWAWAPRRPAIVEYMLSAAGLRHLGLGTWRPTILEPKLLAAGLRHLGLGTWRPAILEPKLLAAGLRHLGLGT